MNGPCFKDADLGEDLPVPGYYLGTVATARWTRSSNGNRMVQVVLVLDGVAAAHERVADYFVVEGATPQGVAFSRTRLVQLYRACGLSPSGGDEIQPGELAGALLEVKVDHELWRGRLRLRVVGYRPLAAQAAVPAAEGVEAEGVQLLPGILDILERA